VFLFNKKCEKSGKERIHESLIYHSVKYIVLEDAYRSVSLSAQQGESTLKLNTQQLSDKF